MSGFRDFIPPVLLNLLKKDHEQTFPSYQQAMLACKGVSYEGETLVALVQEKTRRYRDKLRTESPLIVDANLNRLFFVLKYVQSSGGLNVIDFGGACGAHYFEAKALLGDTLKLRWHVVETPAMAAKGRAEFESDELKFFSDLDAARHADSLDLTFSSGCLQYLPDPLTMLEALVASQARFIYLTRAGLAPTNTHVVTVQRSRLSDNGPGPAPDGFQDGVAEYPVTILSKQAFEESLRAKYDLRMVFPEHVGAYVIQGNPVPSFGYLGQLQV